MTADKLDHFAEPEETLYEFVARLASATPDRTLAITCIVALILGTTLAVVSLRFWPLVAACGTVTTIAGWGLLEHRRVITSARWLRHVERLLVFLGGLFAFVAAMGALYAALGTGWIS